jgi:hypothetical protein
MKKATFNFRLQTLLDEIEMHEHREELVKLMQEQIKDDLSCNIILSNPVYA